MGMLTYFCVNMSIQVHEDIKENSNQYSCTERRLSGHEFGMCVAHKTSHTASTELSSLLHTYYLSAAHQGPYALSWFPWAIALGGPNAIAQALEGGFSIP